MALLIVDLQGEPMVPVETLGHELLELPRNVGPLLCGRLANQTTLVN